MIPAPVLVQRSSVSKQPIRLSRTNFLRQNFSASKYANAKNSRRYSDEEKIFWGRRVVVDGISINGVANEAKISRDTVLRGVEKYIAVFGDSEIKQKIHVEQLPVQGELFANIDANNTGLTVPPVTPRLAAGPLRAVSNNDANDAFQIFSQGLHEMLHEIKVDVDQIKTDIDQLTLSMKEMNANFDKIMGKAESKWNIGSNLISFVVGMAVMFLAMLPTFL